MKPLCALAYPKCALWKCVIRLANAQADLNLSWRYFYWRSDVTVRTSSDVTTRTTSNVMTRTSSDVTTLTSSDVTTRTSYDVTTLMSSDVTTRTSSDVTTRMSSDVTTLMSSDVTARMFYYRFCCSSFIHRTVCHSLALCATYRDRTASQPRGAVDKIRPTDRPTTWHTSILRGPTHS